MGKDKDQMFHPVRPGVSVTLGDYGYFDKIGRWFKLGNICDIPGMRCAPAVKESTDKSDIILQYGVGFNANVGTSVETPGAQSACSVSFNKEQSYYVKGEISARREFSSVAVEIKDQIEKLKSKGYWEANYCVIVAVIYSSSFFSLYASQAGNSVNLSANVGEEVPFSEIKANLGLTGSINHNAVEFVNKINDGNLCPIGFMTVMLRSGIARIFKPAVKYVGDLVDSQYPMDGSGEENQEPIIYQ